MSYPAQLRCAPLDFDSGQAYVQDGSGEATRPIVPRAAWVAGGGVAVGNAVGGDAVGAPGSESGGSALDTLVRPVTILVGHAGSGKTEIAVNLAFGLRNRGTEVTLVDLDLVKPYLRCRLAKENLDVRGIRLVAPAGDRFYADLPVLVPEARTAVRDGAGRHRWLIFDVGGADRGARALGSISGLLDRRSTEVLFVVNARRPLAEETHSLRRMLDRVQAAARLDVTGLVANTHLMDETTPDTVREGIRAARTLEAMTDVPLKFCAMERRLAEVFGGAGESVERVPILAMERHIVAPFDRIPRGSRRRSDVV